LGWIELFRQDITFLDSGQSHVNDEITASLRSVHAALADGHLNDASDWQEWHDYLVFREEQRAIGESMIDNDADPRRVHGYDQFLELHAKGPSRWHACLAGFFENIGKSHKDYRVTRIKMLFLAVAKLHSLTASRPFSKRLQKVVQDIAVELGFPSPLQVRKNKGNMVLGFFARLSQ
jgi:hypothetical protein